MKPVLRLLCLLLILTLLPLPLLAEQAEAPAPNIRVLLRRLNLGQQANLILDGLYTAGYSATPTMSFPEDSQIAVHILDGQLYLHYEGMSLCVGNELRLWRHASGSKSDAMPGIRFEKNGNLYPGDLRLSIADGQLQPVLTLSVEDYLLGVVPYEMSESFPLEALKAQAVCARTYALSHVSPNREWDVVDTTNDQVFKGVNLNYTNAVQAVRETAGIVGFYDGALATCYYSASNGGQTELVQNVWSGRGDWSYYAMVDDPYDLENPESMIRRATLRKDGTGLKEDFMALLAAEMHGEMLRNGFEPDPAMFRVDAISAAELGEPGFDEPSRYMTELTLTFSWSGRKQLEQPTATFAPMATPADDDEEIYLFSTPAPTATPVPTEMPGESIMPAPTPEILYSDFIPAEEEATLTLALFPEAIRALGMSISGADNELVTVTENENAFVVEARRYGHGVGMSQRGAQWMAGEYGKTYYEILQFYYPGMELRRAQAGAPVLPTVPKLLAATPAPPATPTPRPTLMPVTASELPEGAYLASVENIDDDSSLNLRMEPTTASGIIMRLYKHQQLLVLETCEDPAWVHVKTDVVEGYVMVSFLEKIGVE